MLTIHEELLLTTIDDSKGVITPSANDALPYGLAGAALAELALREHIVFVDHKVALANSESTGAAILDEALRLVAEAKHPHKTAHWINKLAQKKLQKQALGLLVEKGVLHQEEKRYLWAIPFALYPQQDASAKYWIKQRLRSAAMTNEKADARTVILLSLLKSCRFLNLVFTKDERKAAERRIEQLVKGEPIGQTIAEMLEEIDASASAALMLMMGA
jgi:hypothetical protein